MWINWFPQLDVITIANSFEMLLKCNEGTITKRFEQIKYKIQVKFIEQRRHWFPAEFQQKKHQSAT